MKYTNRLKKIVNFFDIITKIAYIVTVVGFACYGIAIIAGLFFLDVVDWSLGLNATIATPFLEEYTIYGIITDVIELVCFFFVIRAARAYFMYAKQNSPFSKEASDKLRKYAIIDIATYIPFFILRTTCDSFFHSTDIAYTLSVHSIVSEIANNAIIFVLLFFIAYIAERFEKLDDKDVRSMKSLYSKLEGISKKLTTVFAAGVAATLVLGIAFSFIQVEFEIGLSDILFDGTSYSLPIYFFSLCCTFITLVMTAKFCNEYFSNINKNGTIFIDSDLTLLKKRAITLLLFPIILAALFDLIVVIVFNDAAIGVSPDYAVLIALVMALIRIMTYAKKEQIELSEGGNNEPNKEAESPFLN